jgi:predicted Rdx family selenoprotein
MEKQKKKNLVVVWGGTRDMGRNETKKGLQQIRHFVESQTDECFIDECTT